LYKGYKVVERAKRRLDGLSKRFKYVMSHRTGKIEIVGIMGDEIHFKYHQAKNPNKIGTFFTRKLDKNAGWLDELEKSSTEETSFLPETSMQKSIISLSNVS